MRMAPIFKREIKAYLSSPIAYVIVGIFALIMGFMFVNIVGFFQRASMQSAFNPALAGGLNVMDGVIRPLFRNAAVILLFLMPVIPMRLFAEEKKTGTMELLLTYPVRDGEVLMGKFLAALALFAGMLLVTLLQVAMLAPLVRLEWAPLLASALGLLLLGATFLALGILFSSLTENQIVAAVLAFGAALMFWIISWAADTTSGVLADVLNHLSLIGHYEAFARGTIETKDVIFYLNFTLFSLFLTLRSLESKRWRG